MSCAMVAALAVPDTAAAQDERLAFVIGNTRFGGETLENPAKDAIAMSRSLLGLGFSVIRRENTHAGQLPIGDRAAPTVMIYYSGRTNAVEGDIILRGAQLGANETAGWPVLETANALKASGAERVLFFVDTCQQDGDTLTAFAEDAELEGVFLAFSHEPALGCPVTEVTAEGLTDGDEAATEDAAAATDSTETEETEADVAEETAPEEPALPFADRVRLALATPDQGIAEAFDAVPGEGWSQANLVEPLVLWVQEEQASVQLSQDDLDVLDRLPKAEQARVRDLWRRAGLIDETGGAPTPRDVSRVQSETVVISAPVQASATAVTAVTAVSPVSGGSSVSGGSRISGVSSPGTSRITQASSSSSGGGVQIFNSVATTASQQAAVPTAAGLPEPYIIVGIIRSTEASFTPTETGSVEGTALDGTTFEARQGIKNSDAGLYAELVASGAFDPADQTGRGMARAIQTELARMDCYTSRIDGDFGRGSRAAVDRYFAAIEETFAERNPTIELFRKILLKDDVKCAVVQRAAAPQRSTGGTTTRRNTTTQRATPAPAPQRQAPAASSGGGINTNRLGTGVFR